MTRIERAARAIRDANTMKVVESWDELPDWQRANWEGLAREILAAAEPELYADLPTHWRAPMTMTNQMNSAATGAVNLADDGEAEVRLNYAEVDAIYEAARDAHLKDAQ